MRNYSLILLLFISLFFVQCKKNSSSEAFDSLKTEQKFDQVKWAVKKDKSYTYRDFMIHDILSNTDIRNLSKSEIIEILGEPDIDRGNDAFLYYIISRERIGFLILKTKTLVFKFSDPDTIEWIKVHE